MKTTLKILALGLLLTIGNAQASVIQTPSQTTTPLPALESLKNDKPLTFNLPNMQRFDSKNGVPVIFTQLRELPIVDISITFGAGSAQDNQIKANGYGIAALTATMMTQGTTEMDEHAFAKASELLGAAFGAVAFKDTFVYRLRSLSDKEQLTPALTLFGQMISSPSFDPAILKRNQDQILLSFSAQQERPNQLGRKQFFKTLYGTHPYAIATEGTAQSVVGITREDLLAYKNTFLVADNAYISITGDLSAKQAQDIANRLSANLPKGQKVSALPSPSKPSPSHLHIPYDSKQTHVFIGHLGEKSTTDPNKLQELTNFSLGNSVLAGGDFNAHLMKEIRDKHGYTYGIGGNMTTLEERGYYLISFATQNDKASDAIKKTLHTINHTLSTGISQDELELERSARLSAYPMSLATNSAIHATATHLNIKNLPDSHISDYPKRLQHATLNDVNQALRTFIRPDEFIIITIGKDKPDLTSVLSYAQAQTGE